MVLFMVLLAGCFGDERRAKGRSSGQATCDIKARSCAVGRDRAGAVAFGRFLANLSVMPEEIFAAAGSALAGRRARLALKYGTVEICRRRHCSTARLPKSMTLQLVEIEEIDPPPGVTAIHWRLLTTHAVTTVAEAHQIVAWYRQRWRIEECFRVLKRSSIDLEAAMLEGTHALLNLVAIWPRLPASR